MTEGRLDRAVRFGDFALDPHDERLTGPAGPVRLGHKAFRCLEALIAAEGKLLTKDQLFDTVWDGAAVSESSLTSAIKELRRALGDDTKAPRFIESVYGRGYRFLPEVADAPPAAPLPPAAVALSAAPPVPSPVVEPAAPVVRPKPPIDEPAPPPVMAPPPPPAPPPAFASSAPLLTRRRALAAGVGGAALLAIGAATLWPAGERAAARVTGIAVLPFANMSGDKGQDYFAEGMAEELRGRLARLAGLRVAARTSSNSFRTETPDVTEIGRKLGVAYVIDGSVRRAGDAVRVSAQLVDAKTGFTRWSQSYDRGFGDIIALQSDIAGECARALQGELGGEDQTSLNRAATANAEAFDAYAKGRALFDLSGDANSYRAALAAFDRAIALDPRYAAAHAARARTLAALANQFVAADRLKPTYAEGLAAARRAVELAPDLDEAQSALGYLLVSGFLDFAGARAPYERSVTLGEANADVLIRYGLFATRSGRDQVGLAALRRATVLDPLNPRAFKALAQGLYATRRFGDSIAPMRQALTLSPGMNGAHSVIGDALLMAGRNEDARASYRAEPQAFTRLTGLAIVEARLGARDAAERALSQLLATSGDSAAYQRGQVLAQWNDKPGALAALSRAREVGDSGLIYLRNDPFLDPLRGEPAFRALLAELKIPA